MKQSEWRWFGCAGHLIVGYRCRFHLHTRVGNYRVSTVGDYWQREGDTKPTTVGLGRLYETFVFPVFGEAEYGEGEVDDWLEIDSEPANDEATATANHIRLCRKWAKA